MTPDRVEDLLDPADPPERRLAKLSAICAVLMRRVERGEDRAAAPYALFERAAMLEDQVRARTRDLERALDLLNESNARLARATAEAEAARQNLASAIETIREGFALFGPDDVLVLCNRRFCADLPELRAALVPGLTFEAYVEAVSRSPALILPEGMTRSDWRADRLRRHREPHVMFNVQFAGDRWVQVSEHRTGDGGTVILQTDVTDIVRAGREERAAMLDEQARLIRATLDHIGQGVVIFDAGARLVGWNARAGELLALPLSALRPGVPFDDLLARLGERLALTGGASLAGLMDWARAGPRPPLRFGLRRDGVELDAFAEGMPGGGFVVSFTDVTAERRAIAALRQANETLEARVNARTLELGDALARAERANASRARFVAAASHDLLQPLSAARLFLAAMRDTDLPARAADALGKAEAALGSVEGLLGALLDISRLEIGRMEGRIEPVALGPMLARLAEEFAPLAERKGLSFRVRPTAAVALTDAGWTRRILQNLIANAIRYTERGGVLVGLRRAPEGLRVEVIDTGPGIPETEREAIFREFHRLNARASAAEGMGLGLAIVERAAAMLGHRVTLDSRVGRGSRFALHLPVATGAAPGAAAGAPAPRPRMGRDLLGLLVAPDADLRRALAQLLEGWGVGVLDLADPAEALPLLEEVGLPPDFVLVDTRPGGEEAGLALLARIAARHGARPMSLITASRDEGLAARAAAMGAGVIWKPIDTRILERFVARAAL
jgi:signal transduction histidine kinase